jgi:transcriptional regulator with XRE-family HTH domain
VNKGRSVKPGEPPRVGETVARLRQAQGLTVEELSVRAGVSKSMLSQIERSKTNPTVALVWRLASALGVELADLLAGGRRAVPALELAAAHALPVFKSPDGRCDLRILGPVEFAGQFEWYELTVRSGGALESQPHDAGSREHLTVFSGALEVTTGTERRAVRHGETARYAADVPHTIRNAGKSAASALLVVIHGR